MFNRSPWVLAGLALLFSCGVYAKACSHAIDCGEWEPKNCACGVHAKCHGVTKAHPVGTCRCFGAEGVCHSSSAGPVRIRPANPLRRTHPEKPDVADTRLETE